ncbi:copper resistance protein CopC [Actinomadura graeca]|uniref:Copper resistance protein CopC n=1 Tax=Actinomadura graeca TaxID=2750812 RepID=A0ABX8R276_9ACTN|nr:copper resistance protein CopC [Actinomadura graeca]QXJ25186.1 copper resistance protein CopC [Actinomadura graeca]
MKIHTSRRPLRRLGLVAALAVAFGAVTASPALAHTKLVSSTPAKGATAGPVTEIKLVFSDQIRVAKVVVKDKANKTYQAGEAVRAGTTVTQKLTGALPAGSYTVAYRVVGEDGHPIEGDGLTFTAAAGDGGGTGEQPQAAPSTGGVGAQEQTGAAATSNEQPLKIDQEQAAKDDGGSGMVMWVLIGAGVLVGVGIGVGIVFRAKRKHQVAAGE